MIFKDINGKTYEFTGKYNKGIVFYNAWRDFKIKKRHKCYENNTFAESLYWAHKCHKSFVQYSQKTSKP
jgi:hypothetical protein